MKKKLVCLLVIASLLITLVPANVFADSVAFDVNGKTYTLLDGSYFACPLLNPNQRRYIHYYYSDGFFDSPSVEYNEHLSTMSINLAMAATSPRVNEPRKYRTDVVYKLLADIGCSEQNTYINDELLVEPTDNSIGVMISNKELRYFDGSSTGYTLVPVAIRSSGYDSEWAGNFTIGTNGEAKGFAIAAGKAFDEIEKYLDSFGLRDKLKAGKIKFWVAGYSRGGAVTNLTAKRLIDKYGTDAVYAYAWEAPQAGRKEEIKQGADYSSIHNMTNYADLVPYVAPQNGDYLFMRYGTEHSFPSADNNTYQKELVKMKEQLDVINPVNKFSDEFNVYRFALSLDPLEIGLVPVKYPTNYSPNKVLGDWLRGFIMQLVNWNVPTRELYENGVLKLGNNTYPSFETAIIEFFNILYELEPATLENTLVKLASLLAEDEENTSKSFDLSNFDAEGAAMLLDIIAHWDSNDNQEIKAATKEKYLFTLWDSISGLELIERDKLSDEQYERLKAIWPTFGNVALNFLYQDLHTEANAVAKDLGYDISDKATFLFTILSNPKFLIVNHDPDINLAWARSVDSLYQNDVSNPVIPHIGHIDSPIAEVNGKVLGSSVERSVKAKPGDKVILNSKGLDGEMIFYSINDLMDDNDIPVEYIYRGGIVLPDKASSYVISAYSRYETINSTISTYFVNTF